jgi:cobaltochelatase CobN
MCRNRFDLAISPSKAFFLVAASLVCLLSFVPFAHAGVLKVSLLLGDGHSRSAVEAVKAISKELENLKPSPQGSLRASEIQISVYPEKDIRTQDLTHLRQSRLVIVFIMGRHLLHAVRPELEAVIREGGKVYGVGGYYDDELKRMGLLFDPKLNDYFTTGIPENIRNMVLYALNKEVPLGLSCGEPVKLAEVGIYDVGTKKVFKDFDAYRKAYLQQRAQSDSRESPWVGIIFHRNSVESGQTQTVDALVEALEEDGFNVLPVYGSVQMGKAVEAIFSPAGVKLIVAMGWKVGVNPGTSVPLLTSLGVPVIDAITLQGKSLDEWRRSPTGLDILERAWQVGNPEMGGIIQPTVIASRERFLDRLTGMAYVEERPIPERIGRLVGRVRAWINLQDKPNRDKKVALIYYNYPPGKQNIGASYLNVLPESLYEMALRMKAEGYDLKGLGLGEERAEAVKERLFKDIHDHARNIGNWAPAELDRIVRAGKAVLIPLETYREWFDQLPEGFRRAILKDWGPVEKGSVMIWQDSEGKKFLVLPAIRYGNIVFTPQPSRGWEQDPRKLYHDVTLAPHHQYVAFYLWLRKWFQADAVVHVGTHGTHEWLTGKEVGFTDEDPPEALIGEVPNIYPYIVDNVGEGTQAKRRGMAVIIDHMTPPFAKAGLNRELRELAAMLNDYAAAREKSPALAETRLKEINAVSKTMGLLTDLKIGEIRTEAEIEAVEQYLKEIMERQVPFGLHTFGKAPDERYRRATAEAVVSVEAGLTATATEEKVSDLEARIVLSAKRELDSLMAALSGRYIPAGRGNDPIRNPDSLPTGKNFYAFDPTRVPARSTYETGARLAREFLDGYKNRHGVSPDKITFNLWAVETMRHEGVMESQILHLMGVRPRWDERGKVVGVEAIPRGELGRGRIDVTIVPSGLYRDLFANLMSLLDEAVTVARRQQEEDNELLANVGRTKKMLLEKGIAAEKAERLASVRIFTVPSGAYGTNLDKVIPLSNTWEREGQVADVYFMRMGHLYGQGFWGESEGEGQEELGQVLLKNALSGTKAVIHSRSTNLYATLDNDDFFQYLGGTAMAVRALDGKSPEAYVTNLANPKAPKQESLERAMGREMRSRYLNPEWIQAMMKEGYAGARFVDKVVEHLWGWQVTVPEAVDGAKWNEMVETYVLDRNGLDMKALFRKANNMHAYQSLVARMLETVRKNYWKPDDKIVETLAREYAQSVNEVGLACCDHTCNNPLLARFTSSTLLSVPGLASLEQGFRKALEAIKEPRANKGRSGKTGQRRDGQKAKSDAAKVSGPAPGERPAAVEKTVEGLQMEEVNAAAGASSAPIPWLFIVGFLVFVGLVALGFRR